MFLYNPFPIFVFRSFLGSLDEGLQLGRVVGPPLPPQTPVCPATKQRIGPGPRYPRLGALEEPFLQSIPSPNHLILWAVINSHWFGID